MSKTFMAAALVLAAAAPRLSAQDAKAEAKTPKLAVVDMARISNESLLGKTFQAQLDKIRDEIEAERNKKQADLLKLDNELKALQEELERQGSLLSDEVRERKRQDVVRKQRDRQAFLEDGQGEMQRMQERAQQQAQSLNNEFQMKLNPVVDAVAREKGIDILFDAQVARALNKDFDISKDVVLRADEAERAAGKTTTGPAAKPAGPTPATPKPAPKP
jgi:outer membrane protein